MQESAGERLPSREQRYETLLRAMDEGFCIIEILFDNQGRPQDYLFLETNLAFERQTGLKNAVGKRIRSFAPKHEKHWFEIYGRVALTGESVRFIDEAASLQRWFDVYAFRVGGPESRMVGVLFRDITKRRQAEESLRKSEELLRLIFENATDYAIVLSDLERTVTGWNSGAERLLGYTAAEMEGQSGDVLFTAEDRAQQAPHREAVAALESGRALNERWHVRKDGSRFWGSGFMFPLRDAHGQVRGLLKIMRDRTAERQAEEALRESEERLRLAIDSALLGTWAYYPQAGQGEANDRCRELFGIPPDAELSYELYLKAIHPEDRPRMHEHVQRILQGENNGEYRDEYRVIGLSDGLERWIRATGHAYFDQEGRATRFIGTVLDITDLMKAREVLTRRGEALERTVEERTRQLRDTVQQLETFSYSVVHDLRAPLRSMRSFANVLDEEYRAQLDDTARGYLQRLKDSASRMDALITDVLSYSRVSSIEAMLSSVDLDHLVREILQQYPQFQEFASSVEIKGPLGSVCGNRSLLAQCISNLLGNALKFVPPDRPPHVIIRTESVGETIRLWVEDNGIGIAPEFREKIFGLFQRLHRVDQYPGTGVGLAVVKKAVERMRGEIGFDSVPGQGSRFWIELQTAGNNARPSAARDDDKLRHTHEP